jgi:hypothetical protein
VTGKPTFATVATSGSYNDLSNKPTILNSQWTTNGSNIYYNTGKVGIGTTTPPYNLSVYGSINSDLSFTTSTSGVSLTDGFRIGTYNDGTAWVWNYENEELYFGTNNARRMTILGNGNIGIGVSSPNATLDVNGTVQIGSSGKIFSEITEITGTTTGSSSVGLAYPSGYTLSNTRVLSVEINHSGIMWSTLGMYWGTETQTLGCILTSTNINVYYPAVSQYQNRAVRVLLMKVQ